MLRLLRRPTSGAILTILTLAIAALAGCGGKSTTPTDNIPVITIQDVEPSWSPVDSSRIACAFVFSQTYWVTVVDITTGVRTRIAPGRQPAWSKDGSSIVFADGGQLKVWTALTGTLRQITSDADVKTGGSWSRDGSRIVYAAFSPGVNLQELGLRVVRIGDLGVDSLTEQGIEPDWSPADDRIAFAPGIQVITASNPRSITTWFNGRGRAPAFSPSGGSIAFFIDGGIEQESGIFLISMPAQTPSPLVLRPIGITSSWSPSGREVAYSDLDPSADTVVIWAINVATRTRRQLTIALPDSARGR